MRISVRAEESSPRIPAVNGVRERHSYEEWRFVEIANDIRDIKNDLIAVIEGM
jgi:type III restriction enzyme